MPPCKRGDSHVRFPPTTSRCAAASGVSLSTLSPMMLPAPFPEPVVAAIESVRCGVTLSASTIFVLTIHQRHLEKLSEDERHSHELTCRPLVADELLAEALHLGWLLCTDWQVVVVCPVCSVEECRNRRFGGRQVCRSSRKNQCRIYGRGVRKKDQIGGVRRKRTERESLVLDFFSCLQIVQRAAALRSKRNGGEGMGQRPGVEATRAVGYLGK